jgi:hypothetical protein
MTNKKTQLVALFFQRLSCKWSKKAFISIFSRSRVNGLLKGKVLKRPIRISSVLGFSLENSS